MKTPAFFLIILLLGCSGEANNSNVITMKYHFDLWNNKMPPGLCRFALGDGNDRKEFTDSCHFYHMYDTIK